MDPKICIYYCENPIINNNEPGGIRVILKFIQLLNNNNIYSVLYSNNLENIVTYNYIKIPISNHISENTIVIYPEIIYGNPLNAKNVCRWILYDPIIRGGQKLLDSWGKNDILCSYGDYDAKLNCSIKINVADFQENILRIKNIDKTKKYFLVHKALLCGWDENSLNNEINNLKLLSFEEFTITTIDEMNELLSECSIFISFDLNTYISNIAVLCGSLSIIKKSEHFKTTYKDILEKRGCYNKIGIKCFNENLLNTSYNYDERLRDANLYRIYINKANNIDDFINYFNLTN
jgi:hypothetical protein